MSLAERIKSAWEGAKTSRLTLDWFIGHESSTDSEIKADLVALRVRAKEQTQNNPWAKQFLRKVRNNVVGAQGPVLQVIFRTRSGEKRPDIATAIEKAWQDFGAFGVCTVRGNTTLKQMFRDAVQAPARDGEYLARVHYGYPGNKFKFALEIIDPRLMPVALNGTYNEEQIIMGVAVDSYGAPLAYYFTADSAPETEVLVNGKKYTRIPANEIYHLYLPEWIEQTRGVPWLATGLMDAKMLAGSRIAELTATRAAASKMGFFTQNETAVYKGQGTDSSGKVIAEAAAGTFEILPKGVEFVSFDPQHPNGNYEAFERRVLHGLASGWGIDYHSMTGDFGDVNYSSLRQANLEMREEWKVLQDWFVDFFVLRIFKDWLGYTLVNGLLPGPNGRPLRPSIEASLEVKFQCPRWEWVDPAKESKAADTDIANGTRSVAEVIRARGRDPDEVFEERAEELRREAELLKALRKIENAD